MRRNRIFAALAVMAAAATSAKAAPEEPLRVLLDVSSAQDAGDFAVKISPLVLEWCPRINELLYGADHPLPFRLFVVSFQHGQKYPAFTANNLIHVSADTIRVMQDHYRSMTISGSSRTSTWP